MQWFNLNLQSFSLSFLSILFERSAFHVHRNIDLGFVDAFVHPQMMKRILSRNTGLAIGLSALCVSTVDDPSTQTAFSHRTSGEIAFRNSTDDEQTWI
jgi:hypothetical protein